MLSKLEWRMSVMSRVPARAGMSFFIVQHPGLTIHSCSDARTAEKTTDCCAAALLISLIRFVFVPCPLRVSLMVGLQFSYIYNG